MGTSHTILGIDIGGSGTKFGLVDVATGTMLSERIRKPTPKPSTPQNIAHFIQNAIRRLEWEGAIGCGIPCMIRNGVVTTAANIDAAWLGLSVEKFFQEEIGAKIYVMNDADAAGIAEVRIGAGQDKKGKILLLTLGTGVGSALFWNGELIPNTEFGHLKFKDDIAEKYVSNAVRKKEKLGWEQWGRQLNEYLHHLERVCVPDLFIIGGGVSKKMQMFQEYIDTKTPVVPAQLQNSAGIIGAALAAHEKLKL